MADQSEPIDTLPKVRMGRPQRTFLTAWTITLVALLLFSLSGNPLSPYGFPVLAVVAFYLFWRDMRLEAAIVAQLEEFDRMDEEFTARERKVLAALDRELDDDQATEVLPVVQPDKHQRTAIVNCLFGGTHTWVYVSPLAGWVEVDEERACPEHDVHQEEARGNVESGPQLGPTAGSAERPRA